MIESWDSRTRRLLVLAIAGSAVLLVAGGWFSWWLYITSKDDLSLFLSAISVLSAPFLPLVAFLWYLTRRNNRSATPPAVDPPWPGPAGFVEAVRAVAQTGAAGAPAAAPPPAPPPPVLQIQLLATPDAADEAGVVRAALLDLPTRLDPPNRFRVEVVTDADGAVTLPPLIVGILGWQFSPSGEGDQAAAATGEAPWTALKDGLGRPGAARVLLYRREGRPPLDGLPDDAIPAALAAWNGFKAAVLALFADCPAVPAGPGAPAAAPCWHPYPPGQASALAERVVADLLPLLESLVPAAPPAPAPDGTVAAWTDPPYRGLVPLTFRDAAIFYGRGRETDALLARILAPDCRFLAVVGASGSGKSSLVWAGLLPRLAALPDGQSWKWLRFTPDAREGEGPFAALADKLANDPAFEHCGFKARPLAERLREPKGLAWVLAKALAGAPPAARLLLFIDQFEELLRLSDPTLAADFVARLAEGAGLARLRTLVTLRKDFWSQAMDYPALAALFAGQYTLSAPAPWALLEMVRGPAARAGLRLEDGLAEQIVQDAGTAPGALPLMAYTLEQLYAGPGGGRRLLTRQGYEALGRVPGAIGTHAQGVLDAFAMEYGEETAARALAALFRRLVHVEDPATPPIRRRARMADLCADDPAAAALAERLIQARLLVPDGEGPDGAPAAARCGPGDGRLVDVAHEALLTHWGQLHDWIEKRRDALRLRGQLEREVRDWLRGGCLTGDLRSAERARDMRDALTALNLCASEEERAFLDPMARAPWLLGRDLAAWEAAGRPDGGLWGAERFLGFVDPVPLDGPPGPADAPAAGPGLAGTPPLLPAPSAAQRDFLERSFTLTLARHPQDPRCRTDCGKALAALGDPRFDPDHWWLPEDETLGFREVGAGPFLMGSPHGEGWDDEWERHEVKLPGFYLARWPVTVAQYRAWAADRDRGGPPVDPLSLEGRANHPVVQVSWHEARAYCTWLGERLAALAPARAAAATDAGARRFWESIAAGLLRAALPSEAQWEKAARGTEARRYAGGDTLDPSQANYQKTRLGAPCAVGCFPLGQGPYGCEDQTGNVWEWTRSLWGPDAMKPQFRYVYEPEDGREDEDTADDLARVLRGGAFSVDSYNCRGAVRNRSYPLNRDVNYGFRVVWSPFP